MENFETTKSLDSHITAPKTEYKPQVKETTEVKDEPYTIEETFRDITVTFKDKADNEFWLSLTNGTERGENGEITADGMPMIIHSTEWFLTPESINNDPLQKIEPYKATGNALADSFLKALNSYECPQLSEEDVNDIVAKAELFNM